VGVAKADREPVQGVDQTETAYPPTNLVKIALMLLGSQLVSMVNDRLGAPADKSCIVKFLAIVSGILGSAKCRRIAKYPAYAQGARHQAKMRR
jgi:hypothetical protein